MVAVCTPPGLDDIALSRFGGQSGAGTGPLYINEHTGNLTHNRHTQILRHQGQPRTAGSRIGFLAGTGCSHQGGDAADFVLHLNIQSTHLGQTD